MMGRKPQISCAVRHTDGRGHSTLCPGYGAPGEDGQESEVWLLPSTRQPVPHPYEARTVYGEIYDATADAVEQDADWLTLWAEGEISLRIPSSDLRALRRMDSGDLPQTDDDADESPLDEARNWARHGYEIGQRHCGWSDHGVAPAWLTEGWPRSFDSCEHLKQASEYDTTLARVRSLIERWRYTGDRRDGPLTELLKTLEGLPPTIVATPDADAEPAACCVCGSGFVAYRNYKEQPFCRPCAGCDCAQDPCVRTGANDPVARKGPATCSASIAVPHLEVRVHCTRPAGHYDVTYLPPQPPIPGSPGGWHSNGIDTWADIADGAKPHRDGEADHA